MCAAPVTPRRGREPGAIPRRPALPAAILFIIGIFLHAKLAHAPLLWSGLAVACVFAGVVAFRRAYVCSALIAVALVCLGASVAQLEAFHYPSDHISAYATDEPRLAQLELVIDH